MKRRTGLLVLCLLAAMLLPIQGFGGGGQSILLADSHAASNMLDNPGFEMPVTGSAIPGWILIGKTGSSVSDAQKYSGSYSLYVEDPTTAASAGVWSPRFEAKPGNKFKASAYVQVVSGKTNFFMEFLNDKGQHVEFVKWSGTANPGVWKHVELEGIAPPNTAFVRVLPYSGVADIGESYFDDIYLAQKEVNPVVNQFGDIQTIPDAVLTRLGQAGAVGMTKDGKPEAYFFTNGAPGTFYAIDGETGKKLFSQTVTGTNVVWAMKISPDGNVYFASSNNGRLYRYTPSERKFHDLGINPSGKFVWAIDTTPDGRYIYGAVYPKGKVFEYDVEAGTYRDLGTMMEGKDYVRGIGVTDRYVYAGIGTFINQETRVLIRYDRQTGEKLPIPIQSASSSVVDTAAYGGKLLVKSGSSLLHVLEEDTFKQVAAISYSGEISPPSPADGNLIYYKHADLLYSFNLETLEKKPVGSLPEELKSSVMKRFGWIQASSLGRSDVSLLAGITSFGEYFLFDPESGNVSVIDNEIGGSAVAVQSLKAGPDGKIYLGGYQNGMSVYNPVTGAFEAQEFFTNQPEGIGFLNGKVYFGIYGGAKIYRYDPASPWDYGNNPHLAYDINHQDRPFAFASGDGKLFIGTIPDYGYLGGSLTVYDEQKDTWTEYAHTELVPNQSITGLAYRDGKVYGSTSIAGGLGSVSTEAEAKLFIWDVERAAVIKESTLDISGLNPPMIGDLAFGPDGLLWGVTGGTIFALQPDTLNVVKSRTLYDLDFNTTSKWRPFDIYWGDDGNIYSSIGRTVTVIDPETLESEKLAASAQSMGLRHDGSIYYSPASSVMYRIPVKLSSVKLVVEGGLESLAWNDTATAEVSGTLANGKPAELQAADIQYVSSNPEVVRIDGEGNLLAESIGVATVHAEVSLDGITIQSEPVSIRVEGTIASAAAALSAYYKSGILEEPLFQKLDNSLRLMEHHFLKGELEQAQHFALKMLEDLDADASDSEGKAEVLQELKGVVEDILRQWAIFATK